jgi:hypothetical protein
MLIQKEEIDISGESACISWHELVILVGGVKE